MADLLGTVRKALRALDYLAAAGQPVPIKTVAADLALTLPSSYHLMNTLVADGYAERVQTGYRLGPKAARLGDAYERSWPGHPALRGIVADLSAGLDENAYLAVLRGRDVVITEMVESRQRVRIASLFPGHVDQLHARALGKALLAFCEPRFVAAYLAAHPPARCTDRTLVAPEAIAAELARTRRRGYAEDREEYTVGVCCIGAPIFGSADRIFGALSVSIPAFRFRAARAEARAAVLRAARAASEVLAPSDALEASDARRTQVG